MALFWKADLVLLHPPTVYDFRKEPIFWGPISDVVPSSYIFEMYPVGFNSIAGCLVKKGIETRVINLAYRMLTDPDYDCRKVIKRLKPSAFGIDLHWLPHAHGAIETARICKKLHPDIPVIMGGYSATYFHEELLYDYPDIVDYVVRGDSTEESLLELMRCIKANRTVDHIPNLSWRDASGQVRFNPIACPSNAADVYYNDYLSMFRMAFKYIDIKSQIPFTGWWDYPITAIMTVRGCTQNCAICGGSAHAMHNLCKRGSPSYRSPSKIIQDVKKISSYTTAPIFLIGDLNQAGDDYSSAVLDGLGSLGLKNDLVLELFNYASESFFRLASQVCPNLNFEMSPESHDESIRNLAGKHYTNPEIEKNIEWALSFGAKKFDLYFMTGIPGQTYDSVMETIDYCEYLMKRFGSRLMPFISPLAPFIDPVSLVWDDPEKYGYTLFYKTLEEHRQALIQPSWKYILSYETKWMGRDQIVNATYEAGRRLNLLKMRYGQVDPATGKATDLRIKGAIDLNSKIDQIINEVQDKGKRKTMLLNLKKDMDSHSLSTICDTNEIKWRIMGKRFRILKILWDCVLG
ncbi:TIGR04190 family B12-binding domain/radical SAM domain protein [bacterium]|nr:TIGR04190 family B12-binding domain/radical SAM domain protein [bacterium]